MYLLYDEISPISLERRVMVEYEESVGDHMMLCMDSGYVTYRNIWNEDSPIHEAMRKSMPDNIWDTREVYNGRVWYKMSFADSVIHFKPEIIDGEEYWCIYPLTNGLETDPDVKCVINILLNDDADNPDTVYLYRVFDTENVVRFSILEFEKAFNTALEMRAVGNAKLTEHIDNLKKGYNNG